MLPIRLLATTLPLLSLLGQAVAQPPNIVLIVADDLGYGELGCQGNPEIPTPHIDSLARNGVRFTQGYVTAPFCSASRAGLMTGRYQTRFGYEHNPTGPQNEDPNAGLPPSEVTLAEYLLESGYVSALIGKWHLGATAKYHPQRQGFDEFFGFLHEGHYFRPPPYDGLTSFLRRQVLPGGGSGRWTSQDGHTIYSTHLNQTEPDYDANNPILRAGQPVEESEHLTDAFTREAREFIRRNYDRPFFLYLSFNAVHSPLQATDAYLRRFTHIEDIHRRIFAAMLSHLDDSVGALLSRLRDLGIEENTLIFFLSDNGGPTQELTSSNGMLREGKGQVYEGGLRVPFLAQWKGVIPAGKTYDLPVLSLDIFATAAAASGRPVAPGSVDGVDLRPFLTGRDYTSPHEQIFWRAGHKAALRSGDWKLVRNKGKSGADEAWELYHLRDDPGETKDLAGTHPEKAQQLLELWETCNDEMMEPIWSPRSF